MPPRKKARRNRAAGKSRAMASSCGSVEVWRWKAVSAMSKSKLAAVRESSRYGIARSASAKPLLLVAKPPPRTKYWLGPPTNVAKRNPATRPATTFFESRRAVSATARVMRTPTKTPKKFRRRISSTFVKRWIAIRRKCIPCGYGPHCGSTCRPSSSSLRKYRWT